MRENSANILLDWMKLMGFFLKKYLCLKASLIIILAFEANPKYCTDFSEFWSMCSSHMRMFLFINRLQNKIYDTVDELNSILDYYVNRN